MNNLLRRSLMSASRCLRSENYAVSRCYMTSSSDVDLDFQQAKQTLNVLKNEPGNDVKLQIYALFKQATMGENTTEKPGALNFVAKVKWDAWKALGAMTQDEAKQQYVDVVEGLKKAEE